MAAHDQDEVSTSQVAADVVKDSRKLIEQQVELAKREIADLMMRAVRVLVSLAVAGLFGVLLLVVAADAIAEALVGPLGSRWAAFLVTTGIYLVVVLTGLLAARAALPSAVLPESKRTVEDDVSWLKKVRTRLSS